MIFFSSISKLNPLVRWATKTVLDEYLLLSRLSVFAFSHSQDPERTLNRASDADCLLFSHSRGLLAFGGTGFRVDLVDLLESVSSVVRIF